MFIAIYDDKVGKGKTLELAFDDLTDIHGDFPRDEVEFYEASELEVEFKIVKKETVKSIEVKGSK